MAQNRRMPHNNVIKRYWDTDSNGECRFRFIGDFGWNELPTDTCWKCGKEAHLHRSHIWARVHSHDDTSSNLHLLCPTCHKESENLSGFEPGLAYYEWFYTPGGKEQWINSLVNKFVPQDVKDKPNVKADEVFSYLKKQFDIWEQQDKKDGVMVWDKETHNRFKKLGEERGEQFTDYMIHEGIF